MNFYTLDSPLANQIADRLRGESTMDVLKYLESMLKTLEYKDFGVKDTFQTPDEMFSRGNFDCEDSANFVATVLKLLGIPHTIYIGKVVGYPKEHVWLELPVNGENWLFETTAPMVLPKKDATVIYLPMWSERCCQ